MDKDTKVTAKAKSAIYHLQTSTSGAEKAQLHLMQAKAALAKADTDSRKVIDDVANALMAFIKLVEDAVETVTQANISTTDDE